MTTLLLVPHPDHASLLDGGPCGFVPPVHTIIGPKPECRECDAGTRWSSAPTGQTSSRYVCRADYRHVVQRHTRTRTLPIWLNDAPVLPGLWLLLARIQEVTGYMIKKNHRMHAGPYTEQDARDILALAVSLGIGEGVETKEKP